MSSDKSNFTDGLNKQSYEIESELRIRNTLEKHTNWRFEFTKNDKYAYDLKVRQWDTQPRSDESNEIIGYVEIERSRGDKSKSWVTGDVPNSWPYLTFLQRKVKNYDYVRGCWDGLKSEHKNTVYLKFNHAMDNCFATPITVIHQDGRQTKRSDGSPNGTYLQLSKDHDSLYYGIENCVSFITTYLTQKKESQSSISNW